MNAVDLVKIELDRARSKHKGGIVNVHQAVGVILEEYREFEQEAFKQFVDPIKLYTELLHLATVSCRAIEDLGLLPKTL